MTTTPAATHWCPCCCADTTEPTVCTACQQARCWQPLTGDCKRADAPR